MLPIVAAFTVAAMIVPDAVNDEPVKIAPELPIMAAFTVAAMIVPDAVNDEPVKIAPALPIVAAFTVAAMIVPDAVNDEPVKIAPELPIMAAFTVAAMIVPDAVNDEPVKIAPALPIVAAFTVLAIILPELVIAPELITPPTTKLLIILYPGVILEKPPAKLGVCVINALVSLLIIAANLLLTIILPTVCTADILSYKPLASRVVTATPGGIAGPIAIH